MKKCNLCTTLLVLLFLVQSLFGQKTTVKNQSYFYATMATKDALAVQNIMPGTLELLGSIDGLSAVYISETAAEEAHHNVLVHGPGFIYETSKTSALEAITRSASRANMGAKNAQSPYFISQENLVNQGLDLVDGKRIADQIEDLENYGTRYHTTSAANQASDDLAVVWSAMIAGRNDISVRSVSHVSTGMRSVVLTIKGTEKPTDYVIMGGHLDSTSNRATTNAPGADDNASGIATITEIIRVLIAMDFKPKRTLEFMAFAAEEVGLRGSKELAVSYRNEEINVVGYVQFDMTNYDGSDKDIFIYDDSYTDTSLNTFLTTLMDTYNKTGSHEFTYGFSKCNYGCSDHYSWSQEGYRASFPSEASIRESNPNIHTTKDTSANFLTPDGVHAAKFAKLGLAYSIEVGNGITTTGEETEDLCKDVAPFKGGGGFVNGDKVTYEGFLYERINGRWVNQGACGVPEPTTVDICEGVTPFDSTTTYQEGETVTYRGFLYKRTKDGWNKIGPCLDAAKRGLENLITDLDAPEAIFSLYPNPVLNGFFYFNVEADLWKESTLTITGIKGEVLQELSLSKMTTLLDISTFSNGMYFVKVDYQGKSNVFRVLKN